MAYASQVYADAFMRHRQPILTLLAGIDSKHGNFALREGAMSFLQIADHLCMTDDYLAKMLSGEQFRPAAPSPDLNTALEHLKNATPKTKILLENLTKPPPSEDGGLGKAD